VNRHAKLTRVASVLDYHKGKVPKGPIIRKSGQPFNVHHPRLGRNGGHHRGYVEGRTLPIVLWPTAIEFARLDLVQRVTDGELTTSAAEAEAERLGVGPLRRQPDPAGFDPMQEPFWSLAMVVVWIMLRTKDAVRDVWDEYRTKFDDWEHRPSPEGLVEPAITMEKRKPANVSGLYLLEIVDSGAPPVVPVADASRDLWRALQSGLIAASGISGASGIREPITPVTWCDLHRFVGRDYRDYLMTDRYGLAGLRYDELRFPSHQVHTVWPGEGATVAPTILTGAPGRPTSRHLVADEFMRRALAGGLEASLAEEARHLSTWLAAVHPKSPPMGHKAIENTLRSEYRAFKKP
jgi:hypothetical protein